MAQCPTCSSEVKAYDRRCRTCGAGVIRRAGHILTESPTNIELILARLCHLLALPGMLILGVFVDVGFDMYGYLVYLPLNLIIPFSFWLLLLKFRFVRNHGIQAINFQVLWTLAFYAVWFVPYEIINVFWWPLYIVVLLGGMATVFVASNDAGNAGEGRYPVRIPIG